MLTQLYHRGRVPFVLALFAIIGVSALWGQAVNGTISGTVTDPSGAAISSATVEVKNTATQVARTVTTNAQGRYTAPELIVGNYDVRVTMAGFQNSVQTGVPVVVGGERVVDFTMKIGQAQETVTVEAQAAQVDTSSSSVSTLVETKQVEDLPLNGRNYTQLVTLAPGVQQIAPAPGVPGFYGVGQNYSISGARPEGQAFLLDNSNVQDFWDHGPGSASLGTTLGVESIAEFSIQTNTYSAQFGGAGSAINAVTKSGTNEFHGTLFEYLRNSDLDARAFYDPSQIPAFHRNQFGGSLGGPIVKNKLFFFFNYEGLRNDQGLTEVAFVPTAAARVTTNPLLSEILSYYPLPTINLGGGVGESCQGANQLGRENYYVARVDYNLSSSDSIFTRYINDGAFFHDPFSGGPIPLWPETDHTANQYATVEERHIISPSILNLARFSFVRTRESADLDNNEPGLSFFPDRKNGTLAITGLSPLGSSIFLPFYFVQNKFSEGDDVYWTVGKHSIRFGAELRRVDSNLNAPGWLGGEYEFTSLQNFLAGTPLIYLGPSPNLLDGDRDFREIDVNSYVQDDWKVGSRLTLNIGLRYEFVTNPVTDLHPLYSVTNFLTSTNWQLVPNVFRNNPSLKNFDPRIGFAYSPFSDNKTSIRGGFGIFHDPIAPRTYASAYYFDPPYSSDVIVFPTFPTPTFGAAPPPSQTNGVDYNTDVTPYNMQWNFNIQREIAPATILQVGYVGSRGVHLFYQADRNPPIPTTGPDGNQTFGTFVPFAGVLNNPRVNPALGYFNSAEAGANSSYNALQVNLNRRFSQHVQGQLSYTWSHCIDDSSDTYGLEGGAPIQNPYNALADVGNCLFDRRQALVISTLVELPLHASFPGHQLIEGWQLSGIATVHSGIPLTIGDGFDQAGTGNPFADDRPNLNAGYNANNIITGTLNQWFNPAAFSIPPPGEFGDMGRNNLVGPGFWNIDFSTIKNTKLSERFTLQFRAEFFNIFNHANWGIPDTSVFQQGFSAAGQEVVSVNPAAGQITTLASNMRQIQFALKLIF